MMRSAAYPCRLNTGPAWGALLLAAAIVLVAACGSKAREEALPPGSRVVALGDSLTYGAGVTREQAWPALLANRTGWEIINGGISGDTSAGALRRLPALLEEHDPALVLVALGGNDMLRRVPRQDTLANLGRMLDMIRAQGAKPVLLATPEPSVAGAVFQSLSAPEFYRQIAEAHQAPLIEDAIAEVLSDPELKGDPLHPNAAGHVELAQKIFEALKAFGYAA
jgi:acyl-CoA hydrolase